MKHTFSFPFFLFILLLSLFVITGNFQKAFALTPVADLTGDWSGFAQIVTTGDFSCTFSGNVNAHLEQNENNIDGHFSFVITDAQTTNPDAGYECYTFTESDNVDGTIDGSRITLHSSDGGTFSGWYASSGIHLDLASPDYTGTAQLSPTNFTPPAFTPENEPTPPPPEDTDGDGIPDSEDACINDSAPGTVDGCPEEDTDGDGIPDSEDACINDSAPGTVDGCPEQNNQNDQYAEPDNSEDSKPDNWAEGGGPLTEGGVVLTDEQQLADWLQTTKLSKKDAANALMNLTPEKIKTVLEKIKDPNVRADLAYEYLKKLSKDDAYKLTDDEKDFIKNSIRASSYFSQKSKSEVIEKLTTNGDDGRIDTFKPKGQTYNENPVYYVNGLNNYMEDTDQNAQQLADTLGRPVERLYNRTHGFWYDVIIESLALKGGYNELTPAVYQLVEQIKNDLADGKPVEIHAHSQGAIITSNALAILEEDYPELYAANADKILVYTYGGAAFSYPEGPEYHHRMYITDLIPLAAFERPVVNAMIEDPSSSILWKAGTEQLLRIGPDWKLNWNFPGHAWTGYMKGWAESAIADRTTDFTVDKFNLAEDLNRYSPPLVQSILDNLSPSDRHTVAYFYANSKNDNELKNMPDSTLKTIADSMGRTPSEMEEKNRISNILQLKK